MEVFYQITVGICIVLICTVPGMIDYAKEKRIRERKRIRKAILAFRKRVR